MEPAFDADFVGGEEESSATLVRRKSKVDRGRILEENVFNDAEKPQMNSDWEISGGENRVVSLAISSLENEAYRTFGRETKMNTNFASSEEESSSTLVLTTSELNTGRKLLENEASGCKIMIRKFSEFRNSEVKLPGKSFEVEESRVPTAEHTEQHEDEKYFDGGSSAYSLSVEPSNDSAVSTDVAVDSTQLEGLLQPIVCYVEDKGSQTNATLGRGSETIDYTNKETEVVVSEMVSQTMTQKQNDQKRSIVTGEFNQIENMNNGKSTFIDSHIFSDTGIKEHQHWNGMSKTVLQKSQDRFIGAKDEKQLREHQIRRLEKNALEGNVEDIVKILKEQQTHDLICPKCGSCITKRVILRKRKRTSLVSEGNTDVQSAVSEEENEMTEDQRSMPEMSAEHGEEPEAYGCLACLSLFFRRGADFFRGNDNLAMQYSSENLQDSRILVDKERDSFYCFQFLYPRDHSKPGAKADYPTKISQRKNGKQAESVAKAIASESKLRIIDTPSKNASLSAIPATSTGTGSLLKNDGDKPATVNEAGLDKDVAENAILDSRLNISDKDVTVTESNEKLPNPAEKPPSISIQNMKSHTSTTTKSTLTYSSRMDNAEVKENYCTTTETTKSTPSLDGDDESLQLQEQYLRLSKLEITESQLTNPPSSSISTLNDQTGLTAAQFELPNESTSIKKPDMYVQHAFIVDESKHLEQQHVYHKDVEGPEDHPQLVTQGKVSNELSDMVKNKESPRSEHKQDDVGWISDKKDYICSCIPVSIPTVWSMWSSKELIADELQKPLLGDLKDKQTIEEVPAKLRDDQRGKLKFPSKLASAESNSSLETRDPATLVKRKGDDSIWPTKVDGSVSQSSEISPDCQTDGRVATVIDIVQPVDSQPENTGTLVSEISERLITEVADLKTVTDWDLLKSIVYGGLTVSITSLGVVSSAAGGEAKTLTVIAISLANLLAGFFLIITNILYLSHFRRGEFEETVGQRFWFNGFMAILSYLIFGSLAPITYGFSFRKSNDRMDKFLAASLASLISIILLALGKARVNRKSYIKIVILYVVTGFWASFIGFFAGKYIKELLEKWGFTTG